MLLNRKEYCSFAVINMVSENSYKYLSTIDSPDDLKQLKSFELKSLCKELREFIIEIISTNPGHLASSLGAVEIAVAVHYIFNTPSDNVVWDVGHQAYPHKILTERKDRFHLNRKHNGISGFPKISESKYDAFGTGHSSTSISAITGMAIAAAIKGETEKQHIAVIGDGSIVSGMAFEAMNHAGELNANLLVILNDNGIAIDKNVGALRKYLAGIAASKPYNKVKNLTWRMMGGSNKKYGKNARAVVRQLRSGIKSTLTGSSNLFESFGFRYFGPIDGHDVELMSRLLVDMKRIKGPKVLHVITTKGKGLEQAEKDPTTYHAPGTFDKDTGLIIKNKLPNNTPPRYQDVFGETIIELAEINEKIIGVTPAMPTGCSLNLMMKKMPNRAFDVGIAEQHAVTFSAGMATEGAVPFCNIYSTFMQRAYDQVIHDVALQNLQVIFCLDRGGIVGEDGPTHHGVFDFAYFRTIPNMIIAAPMNEIELRNMMFTAQEKNHGPFSIRYPRGRGVYADWKQPMKSIEIGKGEKISDGKDVAVISIGHPGNFVIEAKKSLEKENISIAHFNMRFLKPIDEKLLHEILNKFDKIITIEDGTIVGGLGSAVLEFITENNYQAKVKRLGIPDKFIEHGTPKELISSCGFDAIGITETVKELLAKVVF